MKIEAKKKVKHTYIQKNNASKDLVFPLLCPVREADWIDGWDPEVVYTDSGAAELNCIFVTGTHNNKSTWIINRYEPENFYIEMIKFTPGLLITKLEIQLSENSGSTNSEISYTYMALSKDGEAELNKFTPEYYRNFMMEWEEEINYYLLNGHKK